MQVFEGNNIMALRATLALVLLAGAAAADPVTIETARGPVEVERPQRVVVFDIAALDTIDALGIVPVGVPTPLYVSYLAHLEDAAAPVGTLFEPDFEAVAALEPDLIVAGGRSSAQVAALEKIAPTIDMTIEWEGSLAESAKARLDAYGRLFGKEAEAADLAAGLDETLAGARAAAAGKGDALILMTDGPKVSAFGPGSRFGWLHEDLGLPAAVEDVEAATHGEAISFEFVQKADPDWLIIVDRAAAIGETAEAARQTLDNPLVAGTRAWQADQLAFLDAPSIYIASGGIRSLTGLLDQVADAFGE